jgi:hypothetical protein
MPGIIRLSKLRVRWAGHVACGMNDGRRGMPIGYWLENRKDKKLL